jgi:hypothetical protein
MRRQAEALSGKTALDAAILARRLKDPLKAHQYFMLSGDLALYDARASLEFAQTKISLALKDINGSAGRRLLAEARDLLTRATSMSASEVRLAWAWRELGRVKEWLGAPSSEVVESYRKAISLHPKESRFSKELEAYMNANDL